MLYKEETAAKELGLSLTTLRIWRQRGEGPPYFKLGRRVVYASSDLAKWLAEHRVVPGKEATDVNPRR